jgi:nucleotide-binding universal stress UspA family protein
MKEIKKIMAAVDLSEYSRDIVEYAGNLAKSTKSDLIIVNVINHRDIETLQRAATEIGRFSVNAWIEKQKEERLESMQRLIEDTGLSELPIKTVFREGLPFRELIKAIEEENVDLVVMGVKGRGNVPGVLVGSTAEKVFRRCPVPMLNVRSPDHRRTVAERG